MDGITFYGRYFNVITMNTQSQKVSMAEKIGYSLGDCSANLVFQMMMIYQTKFYTDIFGLEGAIAGTVMLVARITDAFVDPTVGLLSDRTKTRFGKYRPWVLWTALPFMVFYVLAFYNPGIEDKGLVALYATLSYTLLMSLYSFNNTPYASLGGVMSGDIKDVFGSAPWRAMFILTLFIFITLAMWGSAMNYYFENYVDAGALYAFLDRLGLVAMETDGSAGYAVLNAFGLVVNSSDKAYEVGFGVFNMLGALVQFFGVIFLSGFLANRYGKKRVFIVCLSLTAIFTALFYFPGKADVETMFVLNFLKSLAYAPTVPLLWAMIADVADYSEYKNYRRATGFVFAGVVFALKAGLGIGGAILGFLLSGFGYVSGIGAEQSGTAIRGIVLSSSLIPAMIFGMGVAALCFYPITKKYNEQMQAELADRRSKAGY